MQTIQEVISYLEEELAAACEMHEQAQDKQERLFSIIKAATITEILEEIKR